MRKHLILFALLLSGSFAIHAQTIGLFKNDSASFNGYTLFAPGASQSVFLIDNCGKLINQWNTNHFPGQSVYLMENGNLLHTGRVSNAVFTGGGQGGNIAIYDWDGNLLWNYQIASNTELQHHDVEPMPNGNILVLAWELISKADVIAAGHNPATTGSGLWPEKVMELKPIGTDSAEIVWQWRAWEHLVQDFDSTKPNYGVVADHPELFNLNYYTISGTPPSTASPDWMHCNSVDYNAELDQILLSARNFDEIWVIDHSTTTVEAAGHTGGNSGKGGDLLYRWGNPEAYDRGTPQDRKLFSQHDARWVPAGYPGAGNITIFNNGEGRPDSIYSTIDEITLPIDSTGSYFIDPVAPFGPESLSWTYYDTVRTNFYSHRVSGSQRQPNGTTLICEGSSGHFFEVDSTGKLVWDYINPVSSNGILNQFNNPVNNSVFKIERYPADYPGLQGKDLTPGQPIEGNPLPYNCDIVPEDTIRDSIINSMSYIQPDNQVIIYPNPVQEELNISFSQAKEAEIQVINLMGSVVYKAETKAQHCKLSTTMWEPGVYIIRINSKFAPAIIKKIIKQ